MDGSIDCDVGHGDRSLWWTRFGVEEFTHGTINPPNCWPSAIRWVKRVTSCGLDGHRRQTAVAPMSSKTEEAAPTMAAICRHAASRGDETGWSFRPRGVAKGGLAQGKQERRNGASTFSAVRS